MNDICTICGKEFEPDLFIKTDKDICNTCYLTRLLVELAENDLNIELEPHRAAAMAEVITNAFQLTRQSETHIPDRFIKKPETVDLFKITDDLFETLSDILKPENQK